MASEEHPRLTDIDCVIVPEDDHSYVQPVAAVEVSSSFHLVVALQPVDMMVVKLQNPEDVVGDLVADSDTYRGVVDRALDSALFLDIVTHPGNLEAVEMAANSFAAATCYVAVGGKREEELVG